MPDSFLGDEGEGSATLFGEDAKDTAASSPPSVADRPPPRHNLEEDTGGTAFPALLYYYSTILWNYRAFWLSILCILYVRWSHHFRDSRDPRIPYGTEVFGNALGIALEYARAIWQRLCALLRRYDPYSFLLRRPSLDHPDDDRYDEEDDDRNTLRLHRLHYFSSGSRTRSNGMRRRAASLPDLDEEETPGIISETNPEKDVDPWRRRMRIHHRDDGPDPSFPENAPFTERRPIRGHTTHASSSWKQDHCYSTRPLPPAFGRPEDYPAAWCIYHPVLRVVTKEAADAYDRHQRVLQEMAPPPECEQGPVDPTVEAVPSEATTNGPRMLPAPSTMPGRECGGKRSTPATTTTDAPVEWSEVRRSVVAT